MSILSNLLAPYKGYIIAAVAALALAAFGWYTVHERSVQHTKDVAAATKVVAKVAATDAKIESGANTEVQHESLIYKQVVSLPPVGDIGVVCSAPGGGAVPSAAAADGSGHSEAGGLQGQLFDPSGDILTRSLKSDALVADLQAEVATLRAEMEAARKAHQ